MSDHAARATCLMTIVLPCVTAFIAYLSGVVAGILMTKSYNTPDVSRWLSASGALAGHENGRTPGGYRRSVPSLKISHSPFSLAIWFDARMCVSTHVFKLSRGAAQMFAYLWHQQRLFNEGVITERTIKMGTCDTFEAVQT